MEMDLNQLTKEQLIKLNTLKTDREKEAFVRGVIEGLESAKDKKVESPKEGRRSTGSEAFGKLKSAWSKAKDFFGKSKPEKTMTSIEVAEKYLPESKEYINELKQKEEKDKNTTLGSTLSGAGKDVMDAVGILASPIVTPVIKGAKKGVEVAGDRLKNGSAKVSTISKNIKVSESKLCRDAMKLEEKGVQIGNIGSLEKGIELEAAKAINKGEVINTIKQSRAEEKAGNLEIAQINSAISDKEKGIKQEEERISKIKRVINGKEENKDLTRKARKKEKEEVRKIFSEMKKESEVLKQLSDELADVKTKINNKKSRIDFDKNPLGVKEIGKLFGKVFEHNSLLKKKAELENRITEELNRLVEECNNQIDVYNDEIRVLKLDKEEREKDFDKQTDKEVKKVEKILDRVDKNTKKLEAKIERLKQKVAEKQKAK